MSFLARSARRARSFAAPMMGLVPVLLLATAAGCSAADSSTGLGTSTTEPVSGSTPTTTPTTTPTSMPNLLAGTTLWVNPSSQARATADQWRSSRPADAAQLDKVAAQPQAKWFGNWNSSIRSDVDAAVTTMTSGGAMPVLVAYNIPQRDCGGLSGNNATTPDAYRSWIADFAGGIGSRRVAVILEPDALAGMDCLSSTDQQTRFDLLTYAVRTLEAQGNAAVYLDAGNPKWHSAATMASRLANAGIGLAQGFALNVSNFFSTSDNVSYGQQIAGLTGGKHFIIDTGRNGLGPATGNQSCNPDGRALGERPSTNTGLAYVDAFLWVKTPGESDGACNGAPAAGAWMPEYALGLAQRASY